MSQQKLFSKSSLKGFKIVSAVMPFVSLILMIVTFAQAYTSSLQFEVFICLSYAALHMSANLLVVIGCETMNRFYFIPWLIWIIISVILSICVASVLLSDAIHYSPEKAGRVGLGGLVAMAVLLLLKSGFYIFVWLRVFQLYKELQRPQEVFRDRAEYANASDSVNIDIEKQVVPVSHQQQKVDKHTAQTSLNIDKIDTNVDKIDIEYTENQSIETMPQSSELMYWKLCPTTLLKGLKNVDFLKYHRPSAQAFVTTDSS